MIPMVRHMVGDLDQSGASLEEFSDYRIQQAIVVSAMIVDNEYVFGTDYTFNVSTNTISPDPTTTSTYDGVFIALVTLKAACMLDVNRYQMGVKCGANIQDGDSKIDTTSRFSGYKDILNYGPCAAYKKLLDDKETKASMARGQAVISPFTHDDYRFSNYSIGRKDVNNFFNDVFG